MEKGLKEDADRLFNSLGLSFSTAVNLFVRKALRTQSIPFTVSTSGVDTVDGARLALLEELFERPSVGEQSIDIERLMLVTADDIIDKFLRSEPRRIVAEEGDVTDDIVTEPELDEDDEFVSEELAEVYLMQGLKDMAKETYRKLSLLNPEKSVYFAEIISKIDSNN
jgi:addiction module RelB/DinJ family antitoxin